MGDRAVQVLLLYLDDFTFRPSPRALTLSPGMSMSSMPMEMPDLVAYVKPNSFKRSSKNNRAFETVIQVRESTPVAAHPFS